MSRVRTNTGTTSSISYAASGGGASEPTALVDRVIFYLLLGLLCARALLSEAYTWEELSFLAGSAGGGVTPATTAWMDFCAAVLGCAAIARWFACASGKTSRIVVLSVVGLLIAVALSTVFAGDRWMARFLGVSLVAGVLAIIGLVCATQKRWMMSVVFAAFLATGATTTAKCLAQRAYEFNDTYKMWMEQKEQKVRAGTLDPESPVVINFERRMLSMSAFGFTAHSNLTAMMLVMWIAPLGVLAFAGFGAMRDKQRTGRSVLIACGGLAVALGAALWSTGSKGGATGLVFAAVAAAAIWRFRTFVAARPVVTATLIGAAFVGIIIIGGLLGSRGALPGSSLQFRWHYWVAAWQAWLESPLVGIGRANFGDAFLRFKSVLSPEEVKDPHAVWLTLLTETGPLGLFAIVTLIGIAITRGLRTLNGVASDGAATRGGTLAPLSLATAGPLVPAILLFHTVFWDNSALLTGDCGGWVTQVSERWMPVCLTSVGVLWSAVFICAIVLIGWLSELPNGRRALAIGCIAGFIGALAHNLIDFGVLVGAGQAVTAMALTMAIRRTAIAPVALETRPNRQRAVWLLVAVVVVGGASTVLTAGPASATLNSLNQLESLVASRTASGPSPAVIAISQFGLNHHSPDAEPGYRALQHIVGIARTNRLDSAAGNSATSLSQSLSALHSNSYRYQRQRAALADVLANQTNELTRRIEAVEAWRRARDLYPTDAMTRISLGVALLNLFRVTHEDALVGEADHEVSTALQLDDQRPPEEIMRLSKQDRARANALLDDLRIVGHAP